MFRVSRKPRGYKAILIGEKHGVAQRDVAEIIMSHRVKLVFAEGFEGELVKLLDDNYMAYLEGVKIIGVDSQDLRRQQSIAINNLEEAGSDYHQSLQEALRVIELRNNYAVSQIINYNPQELFAVVFGKVHLSGLKDLLITNGYPVMSYEYTDGEVFETVMLDNW